MVNTLSAGIYQSQYSIRYDQQNNYQQRQKNTVEPLQNLSSPTTPRILLTCMVSIRYYKKYKQLLERVQHRFTQLKISGIR